MKILWKYISHFWYVAINWDIWMAFFMLFDNIRGSVKYGSGTFIPEELEYLTIVNGTTEHASRYEPVSYYMLEKLFSAFRKLSSQTSIIDLGCGKGRMMMVAPYFAFKKIKGIDFAKEVCEQAAIIMQEKEKQFPDITWKVLNENVADYIIEPADSVFFMFNPFTEIVLKDFLEKLDISCSQFPRAIYFLYASPQYQRLLLNNGFAIVYQTQKLSLKSIIAIRDEHLPKSETGQDTGFANICFIKGIIMDIP